MNDEKLIEAARAQADRIDDAFNCDGVSEEYRDHQARIHEARIECLKIQVIANQTKQLERIADILNARPC